VFADEALRPVWPRRSRPDDACLLMHTSGTSGSCRTMVQTEQALHLTTSHWRSRFRQDGDVVAVPIPMAHTYGHLVAASTLLARGTLLLSEDRFDPHRWLATVNGRKATVLEGVPMIFARLLQAITDPAADPQTGSDSKLELQLCLSAGQHAPASLRERWRAATGVPLQQSWGMTELAGPGLVPLEQTCPDAVGVPVPGLEVRIADSATGEPVLPRGETGELRVRGVLVTPGQRVSTWQTAPVADEEGWFRTGDLATCDEHGCYRIVGRSKDAIMTNGYTVQPSEVEEALRAHPHVREAAVIGRVDERRGEAVHAVVVTDPGTRPGFDDLIAHCRTLLARYKVPRTVAFVAQMPLTATGKLDRAALRAHTSEGDQ
jgi:acyl-CoA synthetase (AMP-forming)/AMP-acid ligase II